MERMVAPSRAPFPGVPARAHRPHDREGSNDVMCPVSGLPADIESPSQAHAQWFCSRCSSALPKTLVTVAGAVPDSSPASHEALHVETLRHIAFLLSCGGLRPPIHLYADATKCVKKTTRALLERPRAHMVRVVNQRDRVST